MFKKEVHFSFVTEKNEENIVKNNNEEQLNNDKLIENGQGEEKTQFISSV